MGQINNQKQKIHANDKNQEWLSEEKEQKNREVVKEMFHNRNTPERIRLHDDIPSFLTCRAGFSPLLQ